MSRKELFLRACRGEALPRVPVWMMRQAGRYLPEYRELRAKHAFLEVCKTPELAVEVSLQPFRRLGVDAIIVFSDILIVAEAMGLPLELGDAGPNLPSPVRTAADVAKLRQFDPETDTRFLMDALRILSREAGGEVPVLGFAAAPWTKESEAWQALDQRLPADHLARRIAHAVEMLDLGPLFDSYLGVGKKASPPDLLLKAVLYEMHSKRPSPAQWAKDVRENEPLRWLLFGIEPSRARLYDFRDRLAPYWLEWNAQVLHVAVEENLTPARRAADRTIPVGDRPLSGTRWCRAPDASRWATHAPPAEATATSSP